MQTPGGPSARTMDVLNGATDILNEINKLRLPIPSWDWSSDIDWWPGDPLYPAPVVQYTFVDEDGVEHNVMGIEEGVDENGFGTGGQCTRPMVEEYDMDTDFTQSEIYMDCDDCEVAGTPQAKECWFCGKELPGLWRPSAFNFLDPDMSYREAPNGYADDDPIWFVDEGDFIEDFDSGPWTALNQDWRQEMNAASWRAFSTDLGFDLAPWQERVLAAHGNISSDGVVRTYLSMPRRYSGRAYMERMVAELFKDGELKVLGSSPVQVVEEHIPTNVEIRQSRSRPVPPQRTYPTSTNPTQERRRRNA